MTPRPDQFDLMGVRFDRVTEAQCVDWVMASLKQGRGGVVVTANLDHLRRAQTDLRYLRIAREADLVVADGMPIVWASRLAGTPVPQRVAGASLMLPLVEALAAQGGSVFLLGGNPGVADQAAKVLQDRSPSLRIAGTLCPEPGFGHRPDAMEAIGRAVGESRPDLVLVALGSPKQEYVIDALRWVIPGAWWVGVGISLSFVTGDVPRAPGWMQRAGLEWAFQLAAEPRQLARRYVIEGVPFAGRLMVWVLRRRMGWSAGPSRRRLPRFTPDLP